MMKQLLTKSDDTHVTILEDEMYSKKIKRSFSDIDAVHEENRFYQKRRLASLNSITKTNYKDDQDNEMLIRETQAALKSLSGNVCDTRSTLYKINDQDEDFPNLFDAKNSYQDFEISSNYNEKLIHSAIKTENNNIYERITNNKKENLEPLSKDVFAYVQRTNISAFKPVLDYKKIDFESYVNGTSYNGNESHVSENQYFKHMDSPDSKEYTILQPAGASSRAASVMKDIARDGVVSVSAVSSTTSSTSDVVSSTTINGAQTTKDNKGNREKSSSQFYDLTNIVCK